MYDLFRFIVLRPAEPADPADIITVDNASELQTRLQEARASDHPRQEMRRVANEFMLTDSFVANSNQISFGSGLDAFSTRLAAHPPEGVESLNEAILSSFNMDASILASDSSLESDRVRLGDSLMSAKAGDPPAGADLSLLQRNLRLINLVQRIAIGDPRLAEPGRITAALQAPILLPSGLFPIPAAQNAAADQGGTQDHPGNGALEEYRELEELYQYLSTIEPRDFNQFDAQPETPETPPDAIDNTALFSEVRSLRKLIEQRVTSDLASDLTSMRAGLVTPFSLKTTVLDRFSPGANNALQRSAIDLTQTALPTAVEQVTRKLSKLAPIAGTVAMEHSNVALIGGQLILKDNLPDMRVMGAAGEPGPIALPSTHGSVQPVGVGDLLVVKQQIMGYQAGEVAFIENILQGEIHSRSVRRSETTEESILTERENLSEEERDLQTTERFEMRRESEQVASMDGKLRSPAYGGLLEFDSSNDSPVHGSQQVAERQASTYGKEVTSRAVSKITERVRTQVMRRTVREFEEKTSHEYNNAEGAGHVIGVYQWIDKVYQAQVYNYGRRLLYDIVVPEPGAFLVQALARAQAEGRELIKPEPFTLQPNEISEYNYGYYAAKYEVAGLEAPPQLYQIVSDIIDVPDGPHYSTKTLKINIPAGYEALAGSAIQTNHYFNFDKDWLIELTVGQNWRRRDSSNQGYLNWSFQLAGEVLQVPVTLKCSNARLFSYAISITCRRSESTYRKWQLRTHDAIRQTFERQKAEYEERLANLEAAVRVGALGQTTTQKHALMLDELKKSCISIFTYQYFDAFNGIKLVDQTDPVSGKKVAYAQIRLPEAEAQGKYIRFFEQAFEWEQMMHQLYSYFWGRKDHWIGSVTREDRDPEFADFLKAGAARVVVPVRPGFEQAILHFMETGEIWNGGDMPEINSPLYVPLLDEIKAHTQAQGSETPYGPPWKLRLPTSLVMLRPDGSLPAWREENGEWIPG